MPKEFNNMSEPWINPRYVFPAPGWKCFQCSIFENGTVEFWEQPVVGWGVVEGFDRDEYNPTGSVMDLLVALQDSPLEGPMVYSSSELGDLLANCAFGFCFNSELSEDDKKILEQKARKRFKKVA
jgi:hypothetical protein